VDRGIIQEHGPWADALGMDHNRCVRIKRHVNVGNKFLAYSEFYLDHDRFGKILELPESSWDNVNLKGVLNTEFNAPTVYVQQRLRVQRFPEEIAKLLSVGNRTNGLFQEIVAFTYDNSPISYQMIYTPPTIHMLDLSAPDPTVRTIANTDR
jgi:DNA-binding GntR family transcriptional regulator